MVNKIRGEWKSNNIQAKVNRRIGDVNDCYNEYCDYVDSLFEYRAKIMVLRFDLFYGSQYATSATIFDMQKDLDHLIANRRSNSLFDFKIGHIVKIEYGIEKGVHCHVILFFDGSERKNSSHIHLTNEIDEYWVNVITKGRGSYYNINNNAGHYDKLGRCGIGGIKWDNDKLRKNLKEYVVQYLCKVDQFIKPKFGSKVRLIRRGEFHEMPVNKLGRPRKELESFNIA